MILPLWCDFEEVTICASVSSPIVIILILHRTVMRIQWLYIYYLKQCLFHSTLFISIIFLITVIKINHHIQVSQQFYKDSKYHFTLFPDKGIRLSEISSRVTVKKQIKLKILSPKKVPRLFTTLGCIYYTGQIFSLHSSIYFKDYNCYSFKHLNTQIILGSTNW